MKPRPRVRLSGENGNAFLIIGRCRSALREAGYSKEEVTRFSDAATFGDYDNLLRVCCEWCDVE